MTDTNWQQKKSFLFGVSTTTGGWEIPPSIVLQPTARISRAQVLHLNVHALKHVGYLLPMLNRSIASPQPEKEKKRVNLTQLLMF